MIGAVCSDRRPGADTPVYVPAVVMGSAGSPTFDKEGYRRMAVVAGPLLPSSGSVADVRLLAMVDAAPSSGSAAGRVDQAGSEEPVVVARPALFASDLPAHVAVGDGRNGLVALREFVKRWACFPQQRPMMIAQAPRRHRWYDGFTSRRHDLVRISAVVHALCDRVGVAVPGWVCEHRSRRPIGLAASLDPTTEWARVAVADAPSVCAYHDVWFDQAMIENITVHGFRN